MSLNACIVHQTIDVVEEPAVNKTDQKNASFKISVNFLTKVT